MTPTTSNGAMHPHVVVKSQLRLYIAGQSPKSLLAIANLKRLCETYMPGRYEIETVDLVEFPLRARDDEVLAIPTLVLRAPPPVRKVIGDLSDAKRVVSTLHLGGTQ